MHFGAGSHISLPAMHIEEQYKYQQNFIFEKFGYYIDAYCDHNNLLPKSYHSTSVPTSNGIQEQACQLIIAVYYPRNEKQKTYLLISVFCTGDSIIQKGQLGYKSSLA
ncbi:hypothetical protein Droror1_Dr00006793 [Drosera rotundifolia]